MNFAQSIKTCFRKYANFKGRAMRSEFWWFQLFGAIVTYSFMAMDHLVLGYSLEDIVTPLGTIAMIVFILPTATVTARRLHDIGWSGWLQLPGFCVYSAYLEIWYPDFSLSLLGQTLMIVGFLFWAVILLILIKDSQPNTNKYGPNPKSPEMGEVFS